ncbi:hypothetical protein CLOSTMETH_01150 [[Clostridium] methylpentosum DSM 5476]|uniref:Uncharacterized protein n=1 Tax=[Clostridium] methylpentosum DSM 5476 TaxID=537013 RepID=C0EBD3_9FIRM|nr:hypothetical protein CLOSTMETH_01150 [[Clostridium] methylpentosum DSM 5476]
MFLITEVAETRETSYSLETPPKMTATRSFAMEHSTLYFNLIVTERYIDNDTITASQKQSKNVTESFLFFIRSAGTAVDDLSLLSPFYDYVIVIWTGTKERTRKEEKEDALYPLGDCLL